MKLLMNHILILSSIFLLGCSVDHADGRDGIDGVDGVDGKNGLDGKDGVDGVQGASGIDCWDLNSNGNDDPSEDTNQDGIFSPLDCTINIASSQSPEAVYNHQHFCASFAALGQYPEGCPSDSHVTPTGVLKNLDTDDFFKSGDTLVTTCGDEPDNGLLSIDLRDGVNEDGDSIKYAWWYLAGGYVAFQGTMSKNDAILNGACLELCELDEKCIASLAAYKTIDSYTCKIFYHSDTVEKFEQFCGYDSPGITGSELCLLSIGTASKWASKCSK